MIRLELECNLLLKRSRLWIKMMKKKKKRRSRLCHCFGENEHKSVISQSIALLNTNSSGFCGWKDGLFLPFYCSGEKKWTYSFLLLFFSIVFFFFSWESVKPFICHRLIVEYIVYFNVSGSSFTLSADMDKTNWLLGLGVKALIRILPMSLNLLQTFNTMPSTCQILNLNQILH